MSLRREHSLTNGLLRRISIIALAAVWLAGCKGSFIARRFDDFTAHYNKFYNANRTFQEQERKLEEGDPKIDTDHYLAIFEVPKQQGRSAEFEKVITKCADLLRNHPKSKWVDDALMLIGKSYFYQSNYVGAEQKFNEIINLNGPLKDEAEFWLARTLVAGQSTSGAEEIIGSALAEEDLEKEWRSLFLLLRGDLRTEVGDWQAAIDDIEAGLDHVKDGDTAARALFLLGQLYETTGQYEAAVNAYHRVQDKKPLYELSYAAMTNEIRVLGLQLDPEAALHKLERMMRDNKHFQNRNELQCLHARILAAAGDPLAARDSFLDQLYPSDPTRKTNLRGEVHYRLAELYRDYLGDFYEAGIHFDTASTVLRAPTVQNQEFTPDAIIDARATAATFRDYRETLDRVTRMDSLLYLGTLDQAAFDSAVAEVRVRLAEEAARIQEELERRQTQSRFRQAASNLESGTPASTTTSTGGGQGSAFGFLNYKNIQRVQEAFLNFKEVWGDRPLVPGWRREEAILVAQREATETTQDGAEGVANGATEQVRFLPPVDISEVPRDSLSKAEMRSDRAEARYRLANVLFLSIGLPDSAAKWYRLVIDEDADQPVARRALYALAEVHEALGDSEAARRTLERIVDLYPESGYAEKARARLGLAPRERATVTDTLEVGLKRYRDAYDLWVRGDYDGSIDAMVRTAADYPDSDVAAKALLAVARIYLEKAHVDGSDYYGVIPLGDSLFSQEEIDEAVAAAGPPDSTAAGPPDSTAASPPDSAAVSSADSAAVDTTGAALPVTGEVTQAGEPADTTARVRESLPEVAQVPAAPDTGLVKKAPGGVERGARDGEALRKPVDKLGEKPGVRDVDAAGVRRNEARADRKPPVATRDTANARALGGLKKGEPTKQMPADSAGAALAVDSLSAADSTLTSEVRGAVPDSLETDGVADSLREAAAASGGVTPPPGPAPTKAPEITWTKPEYFINDLIPVPLTLHALYSTVATHFGATPYGKRAEELRQGLEAARKALAVAETQAPPAVRNGSDAPDEATDGPEDSRASETEPPENSEKTSVSDEPAETPGFENPAPDSVQVVEPDSAANARVPGDP